MKSAFFKMAALSLLAPCAMGVSLFDSAPLVGLTESQQLTFSANVGMGWEDNINSSSTNRESSMFSNLGVSASYADYESVDKVRFSAHTGATLYNKRANSSDQRLFGDISVNAGLTHNCGDGATYNTSLTLNYKPEPEYASGISAARSQGDVLNWSMSHSYSRPIDSRFSWTASASYSGNLYTEGDYKDDNRQYVSTSLSLSYKDTPLTSYNVSLSYSHDFRQAGFDSDSIYTTVGVNHSIDTLSSCSLTMGTQIKFVSGTNFLSPHITAGYRRSLSDGLSANTYLSWTNENVDTYHSGFNFRSDQTLRLGADLSYAFHPELSFNFGGSVYLAQYSRGTGGMGNQNRLTWMCHAGLSYKVARNWSLSMDYTFTQANKDAGDYYRNKVSAGVSYTF